jgi:hypothetical protein
MEMKVRPVVGFEYSTKVREFPVEVVISSNTSQEISSKIDVVGALLTKIDDSDIEFGYVQRITHINEQPRSLSAGELIRTRINVFEHDNDFSNFLAGEYVCKVKVAIKVLENDKYQSIDLCDEIVVSVS